MAANIEAISFFLWYFAKNGILSEKVIDRTKDEWLIDLFLLAIYFLTVKLRNLWIIFNIIKI